MASGSGCGSQPTTHTAVRASRQWQWQGQGQPDLADAKFAIFAHTFRIDKQAGGQMWNCFLPRSSCPFHCCPSSPSPSQSTSASSLPFAQFALISAAGAELSLRLPAESAIPPSFSPPPSLSLCSFLSRFALAPHPVLGLSRLRASWPATWSVSEFVAIIVEC